MKNFLVLILLIYVSACTTVQSGLNKTSSKINDLAERFSRSIREPGESMVESPEYTNKNYACSRYVNYQLFFEFIDVIPSRISAGEDINQRLRYALCSVNSKNISGSINRRIIYKNDVIFSDNQQYLLKPGALIVDVFIEVPNDAEPGEYRMEVLLNYGNNSISKNSSFVVKSR